MLPVIISFFVLLAQKELTIAKSAIITICISYTLIFFGTYGDMKSSEKEAHIVALIWTPIDTVITVGLARLILRKHFIQPKKAEQPADKES